MKAAATSSGTAAAGSSATLAIPAAQNSTQTCDTRIAPYFAMKPPQTRLPSIAPA